MTEDRAATVDSVEEERRRIERDLHDGPQQRLVSIAMDLGMAREWLDEDPARAKVLLDSAHSASKEAITEIRNVARGSLRRCSPTEGSMPPSRRWLPARASR